MPRDIVRARCCFVFEEGQANETVTHSSSILSVILLLTFRAWERRSPPTLRFSLVDWSNGEHPVGRCVGTASGRGHTSCLGVKKGTLRGLNYRLDKKSKPQTVLAPQIAEIEVSGEPLDLAFDPKTKTVAVDVEKRQARVDEVKRLKGKIAAGREVGCRP